MDNLQYKIHLILNNKHRMFVSLFIVLIISFILSKDSFVLCMTEENTMSQATETKTILEINIETKKEISNEISYVVGSMSEKIKELEQEVAKLKVDNERLEGLLEESGYLHDMDGDDYPGFYDEWFRESDDDPRW